jgi:hypothetical protein
MNIYNSINNLCGSFFALAPALLKLKGNLEYQAPKIYDDLGMRASISEKLQPSLNSLGIRKDLKIRVCVCMGALGGAANGSNDYSKEALLMVSPTLHNADPHATLFFGKHEAAHIKYNDPVSVYAVQVIAILAALIILNLVLEIPQPDGFTTNTPLAMIFGATITALYSQYFEARADDTAIKHASVPELLGACRFFRALLEYNKQTRATGSVWQKMIFSSTGENRLDTWHPSTKSRLKKVEMALTRRNYDAPQVKDSKEKEQEILQSFVADKKVMDNTIAAAGGEIKWQLSQWGL